MSEISVIGNHAASVPQQVTPTTAPVEVAAPEVATGATACGNTEAPTSTDRVEISLHAQLLERVHQLPEVRQDMIDALQDEIANNAYLTADKLDIAVNRMIDEVLG